MSEYVTALEPEERELYLQKLRLKSGEQLPDPFSLSDGWSDDISKLPEISWRDVTEYLIDSPSLFTKEAMKAYKSLEAYNYFVCGHVQDCSYHSVSKDSEFCFIKSEVRSRKIVCPQSLSDFISCFDYCLPRCLQI